MHVTDLLTIARHSQTSLLGVHPSVITALAPAALSLDAQYVPRGFRLRLSVEDVQGGVAVLTLESWPTLPVSQVVALSEHEAVEAQARDSRLQAQAQRAHMDRPVAPAYPERRLRRVS